MWSDHGTNFTGANRELKELFEFLQDESPECVLSEFCFVQNIQLNHIPEHVLNISDIWEVAIKV